MSVQEVLAELTLHAPRFVGLISLAFPGMSHSERWRGGAVGIYRVRLQAESRRKSANGIQVVMCPSGEVRQQATPHALIHAEWLAADFFVLLEFSMYWTRSPSLTDGGVVTVGWSR